MKMGWDGPGHRPNFLGKSTPKVPQLVIELQNHPPTTKSDMKHPYLTKPFTLGHSVVFTPVLFHVGG
jgi:hypothetical protein